MTATDADRDTITADGEDPHVLWPLLTLFWVVSAAATMAQVYLYRSLAGARPSVFDLARWVLPGYVVWLLAVPVIVLFLTRRFPIERGRWRGSVPVHLLVSLGIGAAVIGVDTLMAMQRRPDLELLPTYAAMARGWMLWIVFTYWFFLAFLLAIRHAMRADARELRATRLETAVARAQLEALKMQLQPHFLFNALNSVSSLIEDDPRGAQTMIARLGELLRATTAEGGGEWTLRRELEVLEVYTAIERVRFGERLGVQVECEPPALEACVPALLLQPLVENAILHGIQPALGGGTVRVAARRDGGWLEVEVSDDGAGLSSRDGSSPVETPDERVGLSNTRQRLAARFAGAHRVDITHREGGGTRVDIRIPWITGPGEEARRADAR